MHVRNYNVFLPTVEKVKEFVQTISKFAGKAVLTSGIYVIDAKSIMGVLSLDLTKTVELTLDAPLSKDMETSLQPFFAK